MSLIVRCPQCSTPLRVGEELVGKKVRCPTCHQVFDAPLSQEPSFPAGAFPNRSADEQWKNLNLEREAPLPPKESGTGSADSSAPAAAEREKIEPWKTLNLSLDEPKQNPSSLPQGHQELPLPLRSRDSEPSDDRPKRARLLDEHEEMRECPTCGKLIYRESRSCSWCGERLTGRRIGSTSRDEDDEYGDRQREDYDDRPRRFRRDWAPHRGDTIMTLGIISLVIGLANFMLCIPWIVGIPLGIAAWWMASVDLGKMRRGEMDLAGESSTRSGYVCAIFGVIINSLIMLLCVGYIAFIAVILANEQKQRNNPPAFRR